MRRALPAGLAFVVLLPLLAVLRLAYNHHQEQQQACGKAAARNCSPNAVTAIDEGRVHDFQAKMESDTNLTRNHGNELTEILSSLPRLNVDSVAKTIRTGVTSEETCSTCFQLFRSAQVAMRSFTHPQLFKFARIACVTFAQDLVKPDVCKGFVSQYFDSVYRVAEVVFQNEMNHNDICGLLFGPACGPITSPAHTWSVRLPPRQPSAFADDRLQDQQSLSEQEQNVTMGIVHISDIHYDPHYQRGALASCTEPLCCRKLPSDDADDDHNPLEASRKPDDENQADNLDIQEQKLLERSEKLAGQFGDLRRCDLPFETIESLVDDVVRLHQKVSHVYVTGDIPPHDVWQSDADEYRRVTGRVYRLLADRLPTVFAAVGNHEAVPPNLFVTTADGGHAPLSLARAAARAVNDTLALYDSLARLWTPWLGPRQLETVRRGGYYAQVASPSLKVIALNTNVCYYLNVWLLADSRDPGGQLRWLVDELSDSEARRQRVHLIGHIPPATFDCVHSWSAQFRRIVQRFNSTITGQFYGHTHYDEFKVIYGDDRRTPINVAFIAPSATPYSAVNPAYKIFSYRSTDGLLVNASTRWFDLRGANAEGRIRWRTGYETKHTFGLIDLSPRSMHHLAARIATEPPAFATYFRHYHRHSDNDRWTTCDTSCRDQIARDPRIDVHHEPPVPPTLLSR